MKGWPSLCPHAYVRRRSLCPHPCALLSATSHYERIEYVPWANMLALLGGRQELTTNIQVVECSVRILLPTG